MPTISETSPLDPHRQLADLYASHMAGVQFPGGDIPVDAGRLNTLLAQLGEEIH